MNNPIKEIYRFNQEAGLIDQGYNDFSESAYQIEEALEGFPNTARLAQQLDVVSEPDFDKPRNLAKAIVSLVQDEDKDISEVERLDKACDAVVFAVGSIAKLGLNPQEITKALNIVMKKNFEKLGAPKDEHGKQLKPEGWTGPEPELQKLLNER